MSDYIESFIKGKSDDYIEGFRTGLHAFAHWKDGVQYLGTGGLTLKHVLKQIDNVVKGIKDV